MSRVEFHKDETCPKPYRWIATVYNGPKAESMFYRDATTGKWHLKSNVDQNNQAWPAYSSYDLSKDVQVHYSLVERMWQDLIVRSILDEQ